MRRLNTCPSVLCAAVLGVALSCSGEAQRPSIAAIRLSLVSQYGSAVQVSVYLEGSDGEWVTGARVSATNPAKEVQLLGFSETQGCYYGTFDDPLSGTYSIDLHSALLGSDSRTFSLEHEVPSGVPAVSQCSDELGDNALIGQALGADQKICLRWAALGDVSLYRVGINRGAIQAYSEDVADNSLEIPANTLEAGPYSVKISAQWLRGDPYLIASDTYSASQSQSSSLAISVR